MDDDVIGELVVFVLKVVFWSLVLAALAIWWILKTTTQVCVAWVRSTTWWQERELKQSMARAAAQIKAVEDETRAAMRARTAQALDELRSHAR